MAPSTGHRWAATPTIDLDYPTATSMLTLFKAHSIITMNPSQPRADAVLVRAGRIIEVGSLERMGPWLDAASSTRTCIRRWQP